MPMSMLPEDFAPRPRVCSMPLWEELALRSVGLPVACSLKAWEQRECTWFSACLWLSSWYLLASYAARYRVNRRVCHSRIQYDEYDLWISNWISMSSSCDSKEITIDSNHV